MWIKFEILDLWHNGVDIQLQVVLVVQREVRLSLVPVQNTMAHVQTEIAIHTHPHNPASPKKYKVMYSFLSIFYFYK